MADDSTTAPVTRPGSSLLSAVIAAAGTAGMTVATAALLPAARIGHGEEALISWVLVALAALGAVLCLYLTLIWGLASLVALAGPASRTGAALLAALRVLAPRLAQRMTLSAVVATTATGLVLAPALAAEDLTHSDPSRETISSSQTAELRPAEAPAPQPDPEAAAPASPTEDGAPPSGSTPLPPLGWGDDSTPTDAASPAPTDTTADSSPSAVPSEPEGSASTAPSPRTVIVQPGDSLWSITDGLLGPAPETTSEIAASWPLLHDANRDVIGQDPDRLVPGQELSVPTALSPQEQS